jgi:hypothetical protein
MTLVVDNRQTVQGPGVHALIVGVSQYDFLPDVDDPPSPDTWNLTSLGSTAIAAAQVAGWFKHNADRLARPLKTLRVLLSPVESVERPSLPDWVTQDLLRPTQACFGDAVQAWRQDCADNSQNVAFFYFGGHGFTRGLGVEDLVLALADFLEPGEGIPPRVAFASNIFNGMAPQTKDDRVALEQFFFFDCCRTFLGQAKDMDDKSVPSILGVSALEGVGDNRVYAFCRAVNNNASAFASTGSTTYFAASLLDAMENAGRNIGSQWQVDGFALQGRLIARYPRIAKRLFPFENINNGPVLRRLMAPPSVGLDIFLDPAAAAADRLVRLVGSGTLPVESTQVAVGRYKASVMPGEYKLYVRQQQGPWAATGDEQIVMPDTSNPWISQRWR